MSKIKLQTSEDETTCWIDTPAKSRYVQEISPVLENGTPQEMTEYILSQFAESSEAEINTFRPIILQWLSGIKQTDFASLKEEKLKDSIYEMF